MAPANDRSRFRGTRAFLPAPRLATSGTTLACQRVATPEYPLRIIWLSPSMVQDRPFDSAGPAIAATGFFGGSSETVRLDGLVRDAPKDRIIVGNRRHHGAVCVCKSGLFRVQDERTEGESGRFRVCRKSLHWLFRNRPVFEMHYRCALPIRYFCRYLFDSRFPCSSHRNRCSPVSPGTFMGFLRSYTAGWRHCSPTQHKGVWLYMRPFPSS